MYTDPVKRTGYLFPLVLRNLKKGGFSCQLKYEIISRIIVIKQGFYWIFLCTACAFFNTALSAGTQIPLCRSMLGSKPGQLLIQHWLSDALATRLSTYSSVNFACKVCKFLTSLGFSSLFETAKKCTKNDSTFFFAYYFLKVHLHHFSKIKVIKKSQSSRNQFFFLHFLLDDRRIRSRISISDWWIRMAKKHMDPTDPDPDTEPDPQHWGCRKKNLKLQSLELFIHIPLPPCQQNARIVSDSCWNKKNEIGLLQVQTTLAFCRWREITEERFKWNNYRADFAVFAILQKFSLPD